jgi:hypothetical protein
MLYILSPFNWPLLEQLQRVIVPMMWPRMGSTSYRIPASRKELLFQSCPEIKYNWTVSQKSYLLHNEQFSIVRITKT